jgi:hypothetical protein
MKIKLSDHRISFVLAVMAMLLVFTGAQAAGTSFSPNFSTWIANIFTSYAAYDGWVRESGENTNIADTFDKRSTTLIVGDDAKNRQYRSILSFNTSTLPDQIVIASAQLKLKKQGFAGNPFTTLGDLVLDIKDSTFGSSAALQLEDFSVPAIYEACALVTPGDAHVYTAELNSNCFDYISRVGLTQFRLRFALDDNNNSSPDYLRFFSGETAAEIAPQLIVTYCIGPAAPVLIFPLQNAVVFAGPINFTWNPSKGATEYQINFMDSTGTSVYTSPWIGTTNFYASIGAGAYKWQVRARNADGDCLPSNPWDLTVSDPPMLVSPPNGAVVFAGIINFTWNAVPENIPVSGATEYYFEYSGTSSGNCGWSNATSCSVNMPAGAYTWHVKARNAISESAWSETWTLTVSDPPMLVSPPNGAVVFAGITNFTWNTVPENIPASGATEYQFEYLDLAGNPILNSGWMIGVTSYSPNLVAGSYKWHVKAKNAISESAWSDLWDLTVSDPPTLVSPSDGTTLPVSGPITFVWNPVISNAVSGEAKYYLEYKGPSSGYCDWSNMTTCSKNLGAGTYTWSVRAKNDISESRFREPSWTITIYSVPDVWVHVRGTGFEFVLEKVWITIPDPNVTGQYPNIIQDSGTAMYTWTQIDPSTIDQDLAKWRPTITTPGEYRVCIFAPSFVEKYKKNTGEIETLIITNKARYTIYHANGSSLSIQEQSNLRGNWMDLGRYQFAYGTAGYIYMGDYTGDPFSGPLYYIISADAAKFVWSPFGTETCQ